MKQLILLLALLVSVSVMAQERPIAGTTVQTTDTSANSLLIGCAVGSTTCTGGIKAGQISVNGVGIIATDGRIPAISSTYFASLSGVNLTGVALLASVNTFTALGTHAFTAGSAGLNEILVRNTVAGTGTGAQVRIGNDADSGIGRLFVGSSTWTTSGPFIANTFTVASTGAMNVGTTQAASLLFWTNNLQRWGINSAGDFTVGASNHIAWSTGAPTIGAANFGGASAPTGSDYSFTITQGAGASAGGDITFGHTFSTAPQCQITMSVNNVGGTPAVSAVNTISTTALNITANVNYVAGTKYYVNCTGT